MSRTVEQLKAIGDVMLRLGDIRKARVIHDAVKLCTVWHSTSDALPDKDGAYLCIGNTGTVHTAHYYTRAQKFSKWIDKLIEHAAREADICLFCPLKQCHPQGCRRFKEEAQKRGVYNGRIKSLL